MLASRLDGGRSKGAGRSGRSRPPPCPRSCAPPGCRRPGLGPSGGSPRPASRGVRETRTWLPGARPWPPGWWWRGRPRAISSRFSGGTGSSNHSGSNFSIRQREAGWCPRSWTGRGVPIRMSALLPTASRTAAHHGLGVVEAIERRLAGVAVAHDVDQWIELQRRETLFNPAASALSTAASYTSPASRVCGERRLVSSGAG